MTIYPLTHFKAESCLLAFFTLFCGRAVWSVTLREEHRCRVFGHTVLREMFRAEGEEVTRNWRTLQHEELRGLHCSPHLIRPIK